MGMRKKLILADPTDLVDPYFIQKWSRLGVRFTEICKGPTVFENYKKVSFKNCEQS